MWLFSNFHAVLCKSAPFLVPSELMQREENLKKNLFISIFGASFFLRCIFKNLFHIFQVSNKVSQNCVKLKVSIYIQLLPRSIIRRHTISIKVKSFPNSKTEAVVDDLGPKKISSETQKKTSILVKPHQLQGVFLANKPKRLCLICENVNFPATKISYFP